MSNTPKPFVGSSWVWVSRQENRPHQYVLFRKVFTTDLPVDSATLHISADSDFVAYLNGEELGRSQFSDYPQEKTYSSFKAPPLSPGRHILAIHAYYRGEDFSEHRAGNPGLIASLCDSSDHPLTQSDSTFKAVLDPAFTHGPVPKVTVQLGFTTLYDARKSLDFTSLTFDDSTWPNASIESATPVGGVWKSLTPRPIPPLYPGDDLYLSPPRIVLQGDLIRPLAPGLTVAQRMAQSALTPRRFWQEGFYNNPVLVPQGNYTNPPPGPSDLLHKPNLKDQLQLLPPPADSPYNARCLIFDRGQEETGLLTFTLTAPAGTQLDIAHGEHLYDGRVRVQIDGRSFADSYTCKEGLNQFTLPFRRLGCQYIEVHFSNYSSPIHIYEVSLRPTHAHVSEAGAASMLGPSMVREMLDLSIRTLRLCMHEHYEDCPWREQSLYAYDSRNQALYGYYAFPNYHFAKVSFDLLGRGIRPDGLLELCAPAKIPITIPSFSMVWIVECQEHWLYSGDNSLFARFQSQMSQMVDTWLSAKDAATGLYLVPEGKEIWNFYEWSTGLAGSAGDPSAQTRLHAPYNLHLHETLGSLAWMFERSGDAVQAARLRQTQAQLGQALARNFYNAGTGFYSSYLIDGKLSQTAQLTNALMLHQGLIPAEHRDRIIGMLLENPIHYRLNDPKLPDVVVITLSAMFYIFEGIRRNAPEKSHKLDRLLDVYRGMVSQGASSLFETAFGAADFSDAGSLCHAWSSLPIYYVNAIAAGIVPLEPGYTKTLIAPTLGEGHGVKAIVPTPHGVIMVKFHRHQDKIHGSITSPASVEIDFKPVSSTAGDITYLKQEDVR
jgi:alpha-L-rhamnosidase